MIKITAVSLVTAAMLCAGAAFAGEKGDKGCCATTASNKAACADYAKLNLTADQKTKLDALQAQCDKEGCTKESMDKFMNSAEGVLSKEQFA
ncbi:MAG TPA: hypothetical protein VJ252_02715, partial [Chthoniobacterales bacterium]|nr:hypothetical protein [Chthoniobacterales bacterium]